MPPFSVPTRGRLVPAAPQGLRSLGSLPRFARPRRRGFFFFHLEKKRFPSPVRLKEGPLAPSSGRSIARPRRGTLEKPSHTSGVEPALKLNSEVKDYPRVSPAECLRHLRRTMHALRCLGLVGWLACCASPSFRGMLNHISLQRPYVARRAQSTPPHIWRFALFGPVQRGYELGFGRLSPCITSILYPPILLYYIFILI